MSDLTPRIGWMVRYDAPDVASLMDLGYTHIRVYSAASEAGSYSLHESLELVAGTFHYTSNDPDGLATDWVRFAYYGAVPGESDLSEAVPVGPPVSTRKLIRQMAGERLNLCTVHEVLASPSPTTTAFAAQELIDADNDDEIYARYQVRFTSGGNSGVRRRVRNVANSGYTPATGVLIVNPALSGAPTAGDEFELWHPKGNQDVTDLMDQAINRAAYRVMWEDTHYFVTQTDVEEYRMPGIMLDRMIKSIEWAAGTFGTRPVWRPVEHPSFRRESGSLVLNIAASGLIPPPFSNNTVIKVEYVRHGDLLQSDSDSWDVPLEWASAEAAMEFLDVLGTPTGSLEGVVDAERAKGSLQRQLEVMRQLYMPAPQVIVEIPR